MNPSCLATYLENSANRYPNHIAVVAPDESTITYAELQRDSDAVARHLRDRGVVRGDRVAVLMPKGIAAIVSLFGIMKAGAAYVPVDHVMPIDRAKSILVDCGVKALILTPLSARIVDELNGQLQLAAVLYATDSDPTSWNIAPALTAAPRTHSQCGEAHTEEDLAYILYTSGSTGTPKGVMITHGNAVSFVEWSSSTFNPSPDDRFSSHAPFHFDLSIFDIYVCIKHGASLHIISEELGKSPKELAKFIAARDISVWYSTPSILTLLIQFGTLDAHDLRKLRLVLFAGEVFPLKHLRRLKAVLPHPDYYNLYGPTETNVCTFARIPRCIPEDRAAPYPIGYPCSHCEALVLDDEGREVEPGEQGLLFISGASVFAGYWNDSRAEGAFVVRSGVRWYNTGDIVQWEPEQGFIYVGRRDRMVKRRGYRIELGDIERALYSHPRVRELAVVASTDRDGAVEIVAFVSCDGAEPPSIIELKTFCKATLPAYMSPDRFLFTTTLPKTSTHKTDYQALKATLPTTGAHVSL